MKTKYISRNDNNNADAYPVRVEEFKQEIEAWNQEKLN